MNYNLINKHQIKYLLKNTNYRKKVIRLINKLTTLNISIDYLDKIVNTHSDIEIYMILHNKFRKTTYYDNFKEIKKKYTEKQSVKLFNIFKSITKLNGKKILDIGTEDCELINMMNKLDGTYAHGINIPETESLIGSYSTNKKCVTYYDGVNIPFNSNYFDVITSTMVIHHMTYVHKTLEDIYRTLKKGGIFIIKEHDITYKEDKYYVDILHFIYEFVVSSTFNSEYYINFHHNYKSKEDMIKIMESIGFKHISLVPDWLDTPRGHIRSYYTAFQK